MVTYDHHFACNIHTYTLKNGIMGTCFVSGKPSLREALVGSWEGVKSLGGVCDDCGHISRVQTALCLNWDASQIACKDCKRRRGEEEWGGVFGVGLEAARRRKKLMLWLQTWRLLKFKCLPTPPTATGTAAHEGRRGDEMWGKHVAWQARGLSASAGALHTQKE